MSRNQIKINTGAVVCAEAEIFGDVTIGSRTIIHPKAKIIARSGPIVIGDSNLIEEQVEIINEIPDHKLIIGDNNAFEVGAKCRAMEVGNNNVFESKCYVGENIRISNGCTIGTHCSLDITENLKENTVIYGDDHKRRFAFDKPQVQTLQIDFLAKMLPNYHHILKVSKPT